VRPSFFASSWAGCGGRGAGGGKSAAAEDRFQHHLAAQDGGLVAPKGRVGCVRDLAACRRLHRASRPPGAFHAPAISRRERSGDLQETLGERDRRSRRRRRKGNVVSPRALQGYARKFTRKESPRRGGQGAPQPRIASNDKRLGPLELARPLARGRPLFGAANSEAGRNRATLFAFWRKAKRRRS